MTSQSLFFHCRGKPAEPRNAHIVSPIKCNLAGNDTQGWSATERSASAINYNFQVYQYACNLIMTDSPKLSIRKFLKKSIDKCCPMGYYTDNPTCVIGIQGRTWVCEIRFLRCCGRISVLDECAAPGLSVWPGVVSRPEFPPGIPFAIPSPGAGLPDRAFFVAAQKQNMEMR